MTLSRGTVLHTSTRSHGGRSRPHLSLREGLVAVGMPVARHPPHRSVREHQLIRLLPGMIAATHAPQQRQLRTPSGTWDTVVPPLCAVRDAPNDVLLGPGPSLQILRRRFPALVRTLHGYYGPVRLLDNVRVGRAACAFPHRPALRGGRRRGLPVLVRGVS